MDLKDAILILRALERDLPQANGALAKLEEILRSAKDGASSMIGSGINPEDMRSLQAIAYQALEDADRIRAKLVVIHRLASRNIP
jgi:hypothetical protein